VEAQQALAILAEQSVDAVIVHRPIGMNGLDTIALIRKANRNVPVIMVSSVDYHTEALAAGADSFLLYDAWLMLGGVVADNLKNSDSRNPWPTCGTPPSATEVKS
jgi:DNA-binding NtrC family response regulator